MIHKSPRATLLVVLVVALAGCSGGPQTITSTFDDGTEGWTVTGDAQSGQAQPSHVPSGGNPGGYIEATDDTTGGVWYWNASGAYLGDVSAYSGGTLAFEIKQSTTSSQFAAPDVVLVSNGTRLGYDFGNTSTHPGTNWTHYEVPLDATNWRNLDTDSVATQSEFDRTLSDLEELWIRGEYVTGSDVGGLDTVELSN